MDYIDTPELVEHGRKLIEHAPWAAVDTEADSLHHYNEKLCLVQISIPGHDLIVDPLASADAKPLMEELCRRPLLMHGMDFDVRMLRRGYGVFPNHGVFDTMIAAQLLGYEGQGLADLADRHCGIKLSKKSQKADWSQRPLSKELLDYAANDTMHLKIISDIMRGELAELGRLEWHQQCCARVLESVRIEPEAVPHDPETAWQVKGSKDLKSAAQTVLKALWHWRETEARRRDRPPFKVLHVEDMVNMARWSAEHLNADVGEMPKAPRHVRGEYRELFNRILRESAGQPPVVWKQKKGKKPFKRWTDAHEKKFLALKEERQRLGKELKIQGSLIATNAALEELVLGNLEGLLPWQREILTPYLSQLKPQ